MTVDGKPVSGNILFPLFPAGSTVEVKIVMGFDHPAFTAKQQPAVRCFFCTVFIHRLLLHTRKTPLSCARAAENEHFLCATCQVWLFREHFLCIDRKRPSARRGHLLEETNT